MPELITNENLIKTWDYAEIKGRDGAKYNLTVTNLRLINTMTTKNGFVTKSIKIAGINDVEAAVQAKRIPRLLTVSFIGLIVFGIGMSIKNFTSAGGALIALGIITLIIGVLLFVFIKKVSFLLRIVREGFQSESFRFGAYFKLSNKITDVNLRFKETEVKEIANTIAAIIFENQQ